MAFNDHFEQSEPTVTAPDAIEKMEKKAQELILAGLPTPATRRRYAKIADALGWRCWGQTWQDWAREVNGE
jgi:hypothetical protein